MSDRRFRFGVVATAQNAVQWRGLAARVAGLGYTTLLTPDWPTLPSPFASLAVAASVADGLRVGTFVIAAPLRPPLTTAGEAHSLTMLTEGRFELGIGTGRPDAREWVPRLGLRYGTGAERLSQVGETIDHLRELDGEQHTPVLIAAGGPRALELAAAKADIVALATGPMTGRVDVGRLIDVLRDHTGDRADDIELSMNIFVVGDQVPAWIEQFIGADAATLIAHDSLTMLRGTPDQMADELRRRRDTLGVSYVTVNGAWVEQFAPVVERLHGT